MSNAIDYIKTTVSQLKTLINHNKNNEIENLKKTRVRLIAIKDTYNEIMGTKPKSIKSLFKINNTSKEIDNLLTILNNRIKEKEDDEHHIKFYLMKLHRNIDTELQEPLESLLKKRYILQIFLKNITKDKLFNNNESKLILDNIMLYIDTFNAQIKKISSTTNKELIQHYDKKLTELMKGGTRKRKTHKNKKSVKPIPRLHKK